eukprot:CAMPEP_0206040918 /NCGR_PEP_ID=MMETSP1466-20131121/5662_1 /ASSEMBLY_ACC=CAM_ASM_001126 /TAXON_ID=44452 /ORGANISM="Pavlova gyrans, Strain CCMP608" /LENGTH=43 /DNA_ID= /DNA_START= /DNA_END= /DNA_ORIENTATION=
MTPLLAQQLVSNAGRHEDGTCRARIMRSVHEQRQEAVEVALMS